MKYFYLNIFFIFILVLIFSQTDFSNVTGRSRPTPTTTPSATPTPTTAPPVRLIVPKLSINTIIEPVSVGTNNIVELPDSWDRAGWYMRSVKPGEVGTAVIVGHYDDQFGAPAIFFYLNQLEKGDKIVVITDDGKEQNFLIDQKTIFPYWSLIEDIVVKDKSRNLILVTCSGWWNQALQSYSERLVIRSVRTN